MLSPFLKKMIKFQQQKKNDERKLRILDNPADKCMSKALFRKDDPLMSFYETKYRFQIKEIRPFAQHTHTKEMNPLYNDEIYEFEMKKFLD